MRIKFGFFMVTFTFFVDSMEGFGWRQGGLKLLSLRDWKGRADRFSILLQTKQPEKLHKTSLHADPDLTKYLEAVLCVSSLQLFSEVFVILSGQRNHPLALGTAHARMRCGSLAYAHFHRFLLRRFLPRFIHHLNIVGISLFRNH